MLTQTVRASFLEKPRPARAACWSMQQDTDNSKWYFAFSIVQVFLVTTLSSGITSAAQQIIDDPKQAAYLLAQSLPEGSNFYASYFLIYGLANPAKIVLNIFDLIMVEFVGRFLDRTPRQAFQRRSNIKKLNYGSNYPKYTNLMCIGM